MNQLPDTQPFTHPHVFLSATHDESARRTRLVVALTAVMMVGEVGAGFYTGSMALLADGFHMATHAGALGIAAIAYAYARRHARDARFSFGTGKVGDLAGFASAAILAIVAAVMAFESVLRLYDPVEVAFGDATLIAVIGLVVNLVSALLLGGGHAHGHAHHQVHGHKDHTHAGHDHEVHAHAGHVHEPRAHEPHRHGQPRPVHGPDNNLRGAYLHVLADALTSVLAIVALIAGGMLGWVWLDPAMGIVGGIVIARWAWSLMRDTASVLLDRTDPRIAEEVADAVEGPGDVRIADLHVWRVGPDALAAIVSIVGPPGLDAEAIRARLAPVHELKHLTVECRHLA
ncbi:CDF family Co(II)/Ni(II) efflux transporter DmeF [Ancylobacter dichloromethanicus]|uniref:Cation transporter n=1 Tax=Ancylobacter dichloromethanicus TaxID=518825 RepID=A0A9W6J8M6_9HYPH|nr:CDF family Co(II)/Ni(II) efflux transporter DmeF [Ancylobacter dichloromethanicus]MBS7554275.1 CDF family Co(II)/Ni(II) efflux transporter DmeF [Ancylobacter dichloromethanicus]GLK71399.1 cation transporter [Ancylobacter dichloromethanicus]